VLWYVYAGPQSQLVTDRWLGGAPAWLHAFAAEGYVVVRVDGRGTDRRGIAFAQAVHRRLVQPELDDQRAALRDVMSWPFVDPARIGVHGWSFGGTMTLHLLADEPTFRCGVAGAPVVDWERYETGWTERYLDRPEQNPDGYAAADVRAKVARIRQPLLVAFGSDDRTVVPSHLDSLLEAAIAAGVGVDVALYPMQRHALEGAARRHFVLRLRAFLDRELRPGR
jgi:dipeptidyl-peptidase-4